MRPNVDRRIVGREMKLLYAPESLPPDIRLALLSALLFEAFEIVSQVFDSIVVLGFCQTWPHAECQTSVAVTREGALA